MNSINTPIFRVFFYVKAVWGHARAELIEAEDTIIKRDVLFNQFNWWKL